ncbi:hypothetical protein A7K99_09895 [Tatumella citrea]|uniref:Uncharacterized protein n=1 Tax=Tatumella citrea TaxID=53336 RepID=A0A1Y0LJX6_TATCI|nr:hypothetical protein A7K98_09895 [Tatumella citrea]ARU98095.1 hypothetical protein A7K99_09895 [Tatumella citrea]
MCAQANGSCKLHRNSIIKAKRDRSGLDADKPMASRHTLAGTPDLAVKLKKAATALSRFCAGRVLRILFNPSLKRSA